MTRLVDATAEDAAGIARLLATPTGGAVRLATFAACAAPVEDDLRHHALVARAADGAVLGHGARTVRRLWLGGERRWVGYLHGLRRDERLAGSGRALARGLQQLLSTHADDEAGHDLTAILGANNRARRVLERLPGAPPYHLVGEYRTVVLRARAAARWLPPRGSEIASGAQASAADVQALVDASAEDYAPVVDVAADPASWWVALSEGRVVGAVRCWDRRGHQCTLVAGYSPSLAALRPLANLALAAGRRPGLPPAGSALEVVYAAHLSGVAGDPALLRALLGAAARAALARGATALVVGLAAHHPLSPLLAPLPAWRLASRLYAVGRPPGRAARLASPEAALL